MTIDGIQAWGWGVGGGGWGGGTLTLSLPNEGWCLGENEWERDLNKKQCLQTGISCTTCEQMR